MVASRSIYGGWQCVIDMFDESDTSSLAEFVQSE